MTKIRSVLAHSTLCALAIFGAGCAKNQPEAAPASGSVTTPAPPEPATPATPAASVEPVKPAAPAAPVAPPLAAADAKALANGTNAFAFDLYAKTRATPGNSAISPASIVAALTMTWAGANGATAAEMQKVLHLDGDPSSALANWGKLAANLQDPSRKLTLRIANRLFGEQTAKFEPAFLDKTKTAFGAPLEAMDFVNAPDPARIRINQWVAEQTENRIKDLLPQGSIDSDTRLALVNAIYFLADWQEPFNKDATADRPFSITAKATKPVPTMVQRKHFRLVKADGMAMLELPYQGGDAAMLIVLPDAVDGLAKIETKLTAAKFAGWRDKLAPTMVDVALPKFTIDPPNPMALKPQLVALGMKTAFDPKRADFTGMSKEKPLSISEVFHKAFVKVDEKGTEAAAATAVVMTRAGAAPSKAEPFKADHPFLYFIVDNTSGLVMFMGRVADPS
ncbi:MAG: serpin family protein [Kofleriaceae bacterium]